MMSTQVPPAVAFIGRHDSGKTTVIEKVIAALCAQGHKVGSIKHHGHRGFDIDVPGKDSWRHVQAGSIHTVIVAPDKVASVQQVEVEPTFPSVLGTMDDCDVVIVEGFREAGIRSIEIFRSGNERDVEALHGYEDFSTLGAIATVTDIPEAVSKATAANIPAFAFDDIEGIVSFIEGEMKQQRGSESPTPDVSAPHAGPRRIDDLSVAIQAGGESKRMGRCKAVVPFRGLPLICRPISRLHPIAGEMIVTTNEAEKLAFLSDGDIRLVPDVFPVRDALKGLYSALLAATKPYVAIVACDMVFVSAPLIEREYQIMSQGDYDVVVPKLTHGYEPLHALYRRDTCLVAVKAAIDEGCRQASGWYDRVKTYEMSSAQITAADPRGGCFMNVNTPDEVASLERRIDAGEMTYRYEDD